MKLEVCKFIFSSKHTFKCVGMFGSLNARISLWCQFALEVPSIEKDGDGYQKPYGTNVP